MKWWPDMSWLRNKTRRGEQQHRLDEAERHENAATTRVINAGARAVVRGSEAEDALRSLLGDLEKHRHDKARD